MRRFRYKSRGRRRNPRGRNTSAPSGHNRPPFLAVFTFLVLLGQAALVVHARPQDLITGAHGMADFLSRAFPPDFSKLYDAARPALETVDIALFGTVVAVVLALPLAILAARNTTLRACFMPRRVG